MARFDVGFTAIGLLMGATLLSFVAVQAVGGWLTYKHGTLPLLLVIAVTNVWLPVVLDWAPTFSALLTLRALWGLIGGLAVTVCATHLSRLHKGAAATWQQSLNGGMFTLGGVFSFIISPEIVTITSWFGLHSIGSLGAITAVILLWIGRNLGAKQRKRTQISNVKPNPDKERPRIGIKFFSRLDNQSFAKKIIFLAALCNIATLGAYITLSTFVTAHFTAQGLDGPWNALALLVASLGRFGGGVTMLRRDLDDGTIIAVASGVGALTLLGVILASGLTSVILFFGALAVLSLPFGAILKTTATATSMDASAVAIVVAAGNTAALLLPPLTGWIRDITGTYDAAFFILSSLASVSTISGILISDYRKNSEKRATV